MKQNRKQTRSAGFSILELLLVLVILGILAGIVGVRFAGQSGKAKVTAAKTQLENLKTAMTRYNIDVTDFPTAQQGLEALSEQPNGVRDEDWDGPYLDEKITEDPWGNPWQYAYPGTHNNDFDLYSYGPDGKQGGDDDIKNWSDDDE
ncbi:MAG: type II secretion system major pseudopilin GspG [Phycisphaeraceae bacterium]|nr:type II secretion system major pseudopilin GspG [Phycisphaeraceae bacterium]